MTYTKNWGPQHATMGRDSVHRINRAIEKKTRRKNKKETKEQSSYTYEGNHGWDEGKEEDE